LWKRIIKMTKQEIYYDKEKTRPVTDLEVDEYGYAIIRDGCWYVFGVSKVKVYGEARVYAYNNATVWAYNHSFVWAFQDARV